MIINRGNLTILRTAFNAAYMEGFGNAPTDHEPIMLDTTSTTGSEEYPWLGEWPSLQKWIGERELKAINEYGYKLENEDWEATVGVARNKIADDQYGVYMPMMRAMGESAATHACEVVFATLKAGFEKKCYDGQYFFDTDHPVGNASYSNTGGGAGTAWYLVDGRRMMKPIIFQKRQDYTFVMMDQLTDEEVFMRKTFRYGVDARVVGGYGFWQVAYGSKQELNADNYAAGKKQMQEVKNDQGRPMGVTPTHLVVPPSLESKAKRVIKAEREANGATNIWMDDVTILQTPWLA